ncbi:MAG: ankyrin repeat domain-containing protein, partial [Candidatus Anstonellales archaeon]
DNMGNTPLHHAVKNNNEEAVKALIEFGAIVTHPNKYGIMPIHYAAQYSSPNILKLLIKEKPSLVKAETTKLETPLHFAVFNNKLDNVEILIRSGANVNKPNKYFNGPLHIAALHGHIEMAKLLLMYGADPFLKNKKGHTFLEVAESKGHAKFIEEIKIRYPWVV